MNSLQLEQLISGYLDDELSPNRKREVENLLQSDPAAKKLYDEFMNIRNEIRNARRHNLPHDFQQKLFERIDAETVSISGKTVEQTTLVDFTAPAQTERKPDWQTGHETGSDKISSKISQKPFWQRLKNPRVWAFPVIALLIGGSFFFADVFNGNRDTATVIDNPVAVDPNDSSQAPYIPPPSLSAGGSASEIGASHELATKDGKPVVEVSCELSAAARDEQYIPNLLADAGYSYVIRENGNKAVTVYEFELPTEQLFPFLASLKHANQDAIKGYKLPDGIISLLHRPAETGDTPTADTIIMRLNVLNEE